MKMIYFFIFKKKILRKGLYNKFKLQNQTLDSGETVKP